MRGYTRRYTRIEEMPEARSFVDAERRVLWINLEAQEGAKVVYLIFAE